MNAQLTHTFRGSDGAIHLMGERVVIEPEPIHEFGTGRILIRAIYASGQPAILMPDDIEVSQ